LRIKSSATSEIETEHNGEYNDPHYHSHCG
jgi:hypothetical protein